MTEGAIRKKGVLVCSKSVASEILTDFHKKALNKLVILEPGKKEIINSVQIEALPTSRHSDCIGMKLRTPNFLLGYTGDTMYFADMSKQFKGCDIIIVNDRIPFSKKSGLAFSSEDTVKLLKKAKPKLAIIQHFGRSMLASNPLYEAREIQKKSGVQVIAATDGMVIDPKSYSAESSQKILESFQK